jgi:hypothetical protein
MEVCSVINKNSSDIELDKEFIKSKRFREKENSNINCNDADSIINENNFENEIERKKYKADIPTLQPKNPLYLQPQITSFIQKPSLKLISTSAEIKYRYFSKQKQTINSQFPKYSTPKIKVINEEEIFDNAEGNGFEDKDLSETISTEKITDQFYSEKNKNISDFENLQNKKISHYNYLINSKLLKTFAIDYISSMFMTLYCNSYSNKVIAKAIEKIKVFLNSILSEKDENEFKKCSYSFFFQKKKTVNNN